MIKSIGEIYRGFLLDRPEIKALIFWDEVVDERVRKHTSPTRISRGTLYVSTLNSVWAHQLSLLKKEIMGKLNQRAGEILVKDIRFKVREEREEKEEPGKEALTWQTCAICGALHPENRKICSVCEREKKDKKGKNIYRQLRKTPGQNFLDLQREIPDLKREEFDRTMRDLRNNLYDNMQNLAREIKTNPSKRLKEELEKLAQVFVALKKGGRHGD
jgi:hypothetical protein